MTQYLAYSDAFHRQTFTILTAQQYETFVQAHGIPSVKEDMPEGGSALWFGSPSAKRVIAHVHGGGLVMFATPFHIALAYNVYKAAVSRDEDVAVVVLSYGEQLQITSPSSLSANQPRHMPFWSLSSPASPVGCVHRVPHARARCKECET